MLTQQYGPIFDLQYYNMYLYEIHTSENYSLSFLILFMTGCKKNYVINEKQKILFQFEYVNYAWGYQHSGFIIDNEGNVLTYENPENWNFQDNNHNLSEIQVSENISKCKHSGKKSLRMNFRNIPVI